MDVFDPTVSRWCLGLRSTGPRPLRAHEIANLQARLRREKRLLWTSATLAAGAPTGIALGIYLRADGIEPALSVIMAVSALALMAIFLPAACLLLCRDRIRTCRAISRDLQAGFCEHFLDIEGREPTLSLGPRENLPLLDIDLLPASGRVLLVNGDPPPRSICADVYESAARPEDTVCYALPSVVAASLPPEMLAGAEVDRRRLCKTEIAEIERHVAAARRPSWALIGSSVCAAMAVAAGYISLAHGEQLTWTRQNGPLVLLVLLLTGLHVFQYLRLLGLARLLECDGEDAWVLVAREKYAGARVVEFLPHSHLAWSYNGDPAVWRLAKSNTREALPARIVALTRA